MLRIKQTVLINKFALPFVTSVEIKTGRNDFTDTAEIRIQNRIPERNKRISELIPLGSFVEIEVGYFPNAFKEFDGYVSQIIPEKELIIRCENEAYNFKRQSIEQDFTLKNTTTTKLINFILNETAGGFPFGGTAYISDSNIGDWKVSKNSTLIDVLAELQDKFKIYSYFRDRDLIVGADADPTRFKTIDAHFQKNVPLGESSFNFKDASADKIIIKVSAVQRDGTIKEIYAYYSGGNKPENIVFSGVSPGFGAINEFNLNGQNDLSDDSLKKLARIRLEALSFTGCDGSITIYGNRASRGATHGDLCKVIDLAIPEKENTYSLVEVVKRFGVGIGYRQDLKLGISI